jgi:hypothetical protein
MRSTEFLQAAIDVQTARAAEYDQPQGERSMGRTVQAFNAITGRDLSEAEGWLLLQVLKDVRQWGAKGYHHDSALDGVAYSALKAEALHGEQKTDTPSALPQPNQLFAIVAADPGQWMAGDELRGSSGSQYVFAGLAGRYADVIRMDSGEADQALLSCLSWVSRPTATPVPQVTRTGNPQLWESGDVIRFTAVRHGVFSKGEEFEVDRVLGETVCLRDGGSLSFGFAAANFEWVRRT